MLYRVILLHILRLHLCTQMRTSQVRNRISNLHRMTGMNKIALCILRTDHMMTMKEGIGLVGVIVMGVGIVDIVEGVGEGTEINRLTGREIQAGKDVEEEEQDLPVLLGMIGGVGHLRDGDKTTD